MEASADITYDGTEMAAAFDADGEKVNIPGSRSWIFGNEFTLVAWVYRTDTGATLRPILWKELYDTSFGLELFTDDTNATLKIYDSSTEASLSGAIALNQWK